MLLHCYGHKYSLRDQPLLPYAENEAYSLQELADSEVAEAQAEVAWQAVETAQAAIERAT